MLSVEREISHHPVLSLFTQLLALPSPSGREDQIAGMIWDKLDGWGYTPCVDGAGNVIVALEGRHPEAPLCCFAAHMDEVGLVVTRIESDGSLRVDRSGWLFPWKMGEGPVEILGDHESLVGVLSMGSLHASSAADQVIGWNDVRVLTGLSPEALDAAGVRPGSTAVPLRATRGPVLFGDPEDPLVGAWSFDNRMGIVALLRLLEALKHQELEPQCPTLVAFTVHEEGGGHGAKAIAQREHPEVFVAVDGCPMLPESPLALDGRPGIWSKDRLTHYDQHLIRALCEAARDAGTALQPVVYDSASSDASLVYSVGGAQRVACIGHVRENSHGYEVARLSAFDNVFKTLWEFIRHESLVRLTVPQSIRGIGRT